MPRCKMLKSAFVTYIDVKPLSVNECWKGRRFKTDSYKNYERTLLYLLPKRNIPEPPYSVYYEFGLSSSLSDIDNPVKPLQDILQKKYGFDDKHIDRMTVQRVRVSKGEEYIAFNIQKA